MGSVVAVHEPDFMRLHHSSRNDGVVEFFHRVQTFCSVVPEVVKQLFVDKVPVGFVNVGVTDVVPFIRIFFDAGVCFCIDLLNAFVNVVVVFVNALMWWSILFVIAGIVHVPFFESHLENSKQVFHVDLCVEVKSFSAAAVVEQKCNVFPKFSGFVCW